MGEYTSIEEINHLCELVMELEGLSILEKLK
ncbi:hypothetical protein [Clostridioides difficile]